jgi:ATP-dependent protease ClpP protease subunit
MKNKLMQLLRDNASADRKPLNLIRNDAAQEATLYLYDVIDSYWGVTASDVASQLQALEANTTLHLRINSPGGDVFEARAIATLLQEFSGKVVAHIDALAASAATTVALAADEVIMADGAYFMIHNAWSVAIGNKSDMLDMAALLQKMDGTIAADYARQTGKDIDEIAALMDAETWFTAQEALDIGMINSIAVPPDKASNSSRKQFNLSAYQRTPKALTEPPAPADLSAVHANNCRRLRLLTIA